MSFSDVVDLLLNCFAISVIATYLYMFFVLRSHDKIKGVIGSWGVQFYRVIIDYKYFTAKKYGKTGVLYYLFFISLSCTIVLFVGQFVFSFIHDPIYIDNTIKP